MRWSETAERYVHRLAEANHLRPTYLRQFLTTPPNSLGSIQLEKLAALTGRDPANLVRAVPDRAPRTRTPGRSRQNEARKTGRSRPPARCRHDPPYPRRR
jgi:hypothetical protein